MADIEKTLAMITPGLCLEAMSFAKDAYYYKGIKKTTKEQQRQLVYEWYVYAQKHQIYFDKPFLYMILDAVHKLDKSPPPSLVKKRTDEYRNWENNCEEYNAFWVEMRSNNVDLKGISSLSKKLEKYMKRVVKDDITLAEYMRIRDKFDFISANKEPWDCHERKRLRYKIDQIERFSVKRCYLRPPLPGYVKSASGFNMYISQPISS